jgi:ketosteroid isomerase-like protein
MSAEISREIAKKWMLAFNTHNLNDLLALYHKDAIHFSPKLLQRKPETNGLIKGQAALRDWWQGAFERLPSLHYEPTNIIAEDNAIFMEYVRSVDGENDLKVGEVLEISEGKIIASRVYHA